MVGTEHEHSHDEQHFDEQHSAIGGGRSCCQDVSWKLALSGPVIAIKSTPARPTAIVP